MTPDAPLIKGCRFLNCGRVEAHAHTADELCDESGCFQLKEPMHPHAIPQYETQQDVSMLTERMLRCLRGEHEPFGISPEWRVSELTHWCLHCRCLYVEV